MLDLEEKPIIDVPAFNRKFYKVGNPIIVREIPSEPYHGIIKSVNHQQLIVVTVEGGNVIEKEINVFEVTGGKIKLTR